MWDERFSQVSFFYGTQPNDFLKEASKRLPQGAEILSLGEGEGRNAIFLAKQGYRVTALDGSKVGLEKLSQWASKEKLEIPTIHADVTQFDFSQKKWDAIVAIWLHMPSESRRKMHRAAANALKSGGFFILESYTPDQLQYGTGGPKELTMLPTAKDIASEFESLAPVVLEEKIREVQEGAGHTGKSAVVQFIGRAK